MVSEANDRVNYYFMIREVKEIRKRTRTKGYELTEEELSQVRQLQAGRYDRWEWNFDGDV